MYNVLGCSALGLCESWKPLDESQWLAEVNKQLIKVRLETVEDYQVLKEAIQLRRYKKRPIAGRLVTKNFKTDSFELKPYDRLHFGGPIQALDDFDHLAAFPCTVYFFRVLHHELNFICPFWDVVGLQEGIVGLGISHLCFDVLHTLDLGVVQHFVGTVMMRLIDDAADVLATVS